MFQRNIQVGRMPGAACLAAAGTMAMGKSEKWRPYLVTDSAAETTAVEIIVCHDVPDNSFVFASR